MTDTQTPPVDKPIDPLLGNELSPVVVSLLKGPVYRDAKPELWQALLRAQAKARDHLAVLGLALTIDDAEGYAFVRSAQAEGDADAAGEASLVPRLVARRELTFPVSLLLALLRRRLAEFDNNQADQTRLVVTRNEVVEMMRIFLPTGSNDARTVDRIDAHLNKAVELGFIKRLNARTANADGGRFEVRRILKAYVDGQWLNRFDEQLAAYHQRLQAEAESEGTGE